VKDALELLQRIRGWDMLDACADGPYWKAEIDEVLKARQNAYTEREAASVLQVSIHTIRAWRYQRRLAYTKIGRSVRIPRSEVRRLVRRGAVPAFPPLKQSEA
jgi:excisionase family DNA binding protein